MADCISMLSNILRIERDDVVFFKGSFTSDIAKQITQVHVFEESKSNHVTETREIDNCEGYQRPALTRRQNKFAEYLEERSDGETFAPPVILNARGLWEFEPSDGSSNYGTLCVRGVANVIDGQHRLGGYIRHREDHGTEAPRHVDFIAYENLSGDREKWVFYTINTNQKGVPAALSVIIDDEKWHNRLARQVAEESSSPFMGKISMAGQPGGQYLWKLNAVAKNIERMFKSGAFSNTPEESRYDIFVRYWEIIRETHSEAWDDFDRPTRERTHKLLELTGLVAYSRLFDDRFSKYLVRGIMAWDAVREDLDELASQLDLTKEGEFKGRTGEYGAGQILQRMQEIFSQPVQGTG